MWPLKAGQMASGITFSTTHRNFIKTRTFLRFWTPAHPYHTVRPNSRHFPNFGRWRTLITPLDPTRDVFPLLDAGVPLSQLWTCLPHSGRRRTLITAADPDPPPTSAPAYPYHSGGPGSPHFGRRRTLIAAVDPLRNGKPLGNMIGGRQPPY
ncbi:hypothetical protein Y032_0649g1122 [Ancylostoma ceylanicum]|uniref:Uncharacterized protein n=1 Tax=Ancylostoma ceylanicum TaxID=53326 RepID=A0A016WII7_9BILA|nr:hypothetical protein Y032_0649g1122 [Ancylostoma ceylanicum]